jgi:hypothetical protein
MKCHIEWGWGTDTYNVFLFRRMRDSTHYLQHEGGDEWREIEVKNGDRSPDDLKPTFSMHREMLETFVKEAAKIPTPEDATVEHLKDARDTRDRLLRIVEHKMGLSS